MPNVAAREVYGSVEAMLTDVGARDRGPWTKNADSLSGSPFERVAAGYDDAVPRLIPGGWAALAAVASAAHDLALALAIDPAPLVAALEETPGTLIHGDWKFGNLGSHPDGRTVLVDWGWPDRGWYLAVNCDRLPESKVDAIGWLRDRLERHGVETSGWWERQVALGLVGAFVQHGWSKPHDPVELGWWLERILPIARELVG